LHSPESFLGREDAKFPEEKMTYRIDLLIEEKVVIEIKTVETFNDV